MGRAGKISARSLELAQKVADLLLARGEVNGAVRKVDSPSLDERYSLTPADDTEIEKP
jgi:hypothetical protein